MRKILAIIFVFLGVGIIIGGVVLQQNSKPKKEKESTNEKEELKLDIVNNYKLKDTCTTYSKVPAYLYFTDFTKVSFNYPDCVHEYNLNHWSKQLYDELYNDDIKITITREKDTPQTILKKYKTQLIGWKNDGMYADAEYTDIMELTFKNGIKAHFFQYNYKTEFLSVTSFYSQWYVVIEIDEKNSLLLDIHTDKSIMSQKAIFDIINSIKVEKVDTILNSKVEGDYQIGTIKQNGFKKYDHGYEVTYKVNKKYREQETTATDINGTVFGYEELGEDVYVLYEMETNSKSTLEVAQAFHKVNAEEETINKRNIKHGNVIQKEINNKKIIYFISSYDYYNENKKTSTYYPSYVYYELEPNLFLKIYINNRNHEINEAFISEFLNFTAEEY